MGVPLPKELQRKELQSLLQRREKIENERSLRWQRLGEDEQERRDRIALENSRRREQIEEDDDVMTAAEVARRLRVSLRTLYGWAESGAIPAKKIARTWRFSRQTLREFLRK